MAKLTSSNVKHVRSEVTRYAKVWRKISDCVEGEEAIKLATDDYLPRPSASDTSEENRARYDAYLQRAVYYNATGRTLEGLIGQVFSRETQQTIPKSLLAVKHDAEGDGVSLEQQAKRALGFNLMFGRGGLFVDYPKTEGVVSKAQLESDEVRPIIKLYRPEDIINWRTKIQGSKVVLSLVVLRDFVDASTDEFTTDVEERYRVLRLVDGQYSQQIYRFEKKAGSREDEEVIEDEVTVLNASGEPFPVIPFTFFGAENNDHTVDKPPLSDLASINIAHYRNSADYEESCFVTGQPTVWASGLTTDWVEKHLSGVLALGARGGIPLPRDAQAGILQCEPNTMPFEAMAHKERQMVALGAKLVEQKTVQRTATEATQDEVAETSILGSCTKNVSSAYTLALWWARAFVEAGSVLDAVTEMEKEATDKEVAFNLNSDFDLAKLSPQEVQGVIAAWMAEAISFTEMRRTLKRGQMAYQDDEMMKAEIAENPAINTMAERTLQLQEEATNEGDNNNDDQDNEDNDDE